MSPRKQLEFQWKGLLSLSIIKMNFLCCLGEMLGSFICSVIIMLQFDSYLSHPILFLLTTLLANEFSVKNLNNVSFNEHYKEKLSVHPILIISPWKVWFWGIIHCFLFSSPGGSKSIANAKFVKGLGPSPCRRSTAPAKWLCSTKITMG